MSDLTRGIYQHISVPGVTPTVKQLKLYGLAINLPDRIMYSLNVADEVIPLPLSLELDIANYAGYGVPLEGVIPDSVPEHIRLGNVRSLADIFIHIFYSRPEAESDAILSKGDLIDTLSVKVPKEANTVALRRITVNEVKVVELTFNTGEVFTLPVSAIVHDERHVLSIGAVPGTRITQSFSRKDGTLLMARPVLAALPGDLEYNDPTLELVVEFSPVNDEVIVQGFKLNMFHYRYGNPVLNTLGTRHNPIELSVVRDTSI